MACVPALSQPLLTQYERQTPVSRKDTSCKNGYRRTFTSSKLTVFATREVLYEPSQHSFCEPNEVQSGEKHVFRYALSLADFTQFKNFLDRADVKAIQNFFNAGPGVGNFKIAIRRPSGVQNIDAVSLMPKHIQLVKDPALVHLVCRAKEMARVASKSNETPDWCRER
jgi:hypothetical protein